MKATKSNSDQNISRHRGFPNPADEHNDYLALDLNHLLIKNPSSTFLFRINGHAYSDQGIYDGDLVVVNRALTAKPGSLIVVWESTGFKLCRWPNQDLSDNWGVISAVIRTFG